MIEKVKQFSFFIKKNQLYFWMAVLTALLYSATKVLMSVLMQYAIDISISGNTEKLKLFALQVCLYLLILLLIGFIAFHLKSRYIKKATKKYTISVLQAMLRKTMLEYQKNDVGTYITKLSNDLNIIEINYLDGSIVIIRELLTLMFIIVLMLYYSVTMFLVSVVCFFIPMLISAISSRKVKDNLRDISEKSARFIDVLKDIFGGFPIIKTFMAEKEMLGEATTRFDDYNEVKEKKNNLEGRIATLSDFSSLLVLSIVFFVGTYLVTKGKITVGALMAFLQLLSFAIYPLQVLPKAITNFFACSGIIVTEKGEKCDVATNMKISFNKEIKVKNVSYGYDSDQCVLQDVDLTFQRGKNYVILGESGSGKSTLLKLLIKYYPDYQGEILIDDVSLRNLKIEELYQTVSIIQQEVFLFNTSLRNNITLFKDYSDEKLQYAISLSGLSDVVTSKGIDFQCGENGCNLSGGERQRIAIARALIRGVKVLIMDEATSNLDGIMAYQIERQLLEIPDITLIAVEHKCFKELLPKYDNIIVLAKGRVVECDTYEKMIDKNGYLRNILRLSDTQKET